MRRPFSRSDSSLSQPQELFETTAIAFPSPNSDTPSLIQATPDFRTNSVMGNHFRNDEFSPTSPLNFTDPIHVSPDSDFLLFHPSNSGDQSPNDPPAEVDVPNMRDLIRSYDQFQEDHKPPCLPVTSLFTKLNVPAVGFQFMVPDEIVSTQYLRKFSDLQNLVRREVADSEAALTRADQIFRSNTPQLLIDGTVLSSDDLKLLTRFVSVDYLNSASKIQGIIRELDEVSSRDSETYLGLESAIKKVISKRRIDPQMRNVDELEKVNERIEQLKEHSIQLLGWQNRFVFLTNLLCFQVRSIRKSVGIISLSFPAPLMTTKNAIEAHSQAANQQRNRGLRAEIDQIGANLPYTRFDGSRVVVTFGSLQQEVRFVVEFKINNGYPWTRLIPETKVQLGNVKLIVQMVASICRRALWDRKPLVMICQRIVEECRTQTWS
jgi:hypothetical protein